jgi:transglutaminase-like putative cysteine protease
MRDRIGQHAFEMTAAAVALTCAAHAMHLPIWAWIALPSIIALRIVTRRRGAGPAPMWLRIPAALLLLVVVAMEYGTVFGRDPGSVLGCGLLALKLLETERARDARVAIGFSGFVLISALLFTQTLWFTLAASLGIVVLLAALVSLQPASATTTHRLRRELALGARLLAWGLPLAAAGFVLIPRLASPLWGSQDRNLQGRSGLDDRMQPGAFSDLLLDDSPALRVYFDALPPPQRELYFRAIVLGEFDGSTWTRSRRDDFRRPEDAERKGEPIDYTIALEPTDRRWLPALDLATVAPGNAHFTATREMLSDAPVTQAREYRVRSSTRYALASKLDARERERALALPEGFNPRARALAAEWRDAGRSDDAVVRSALDLFHARFSYTLNPPLLGRNSVDEFLFDTQKGFCEHYASAFVFLMRAAGVPARVVTGYQGGWWNATGGYLLVRNSDAHAWAEIWIEGRGWVRVDPTAAVSPARISLGAQAANDSDAWSQAEWVRAIRDRFDLVNGLWTRAIIRFDALRQRGMLTSFGVSDPNPGDLLLVLSAILAVVLALATLWALRELKPLRGDALDRAWSRLGRRLAREGVTREASEGPLDWLARARAAAPASASALGDLVQDYVDLRYGAPEPAAERVRAFSRAVRKFRVARAA